MQQPHNTPAPRSARIARPRRSFPSPFRKAFQSLILIFLLPFLNACAAAEPRVPGHDSYCFMTTYTEGFDDYILEAEYFYGRKKPYSINANGAFRGLIYFYPLTVKWKTVDGGSWEENIPIPDLVGDLKVKKHGLWGKTIFSEPCLHLRLTEEALEIDYIVGEMSDKRIGSNGEQYIDGRDIRYPVFQKTYNYKK